MLRAEDLVRAATSGGTPQVLELLRREAQQLGGDVMLAPAGEPLPTTWARALAASAVAHAGPGVKSREGSFVHQARLSVSRTYGAEVLPPPLVETPGTDAGAGMWATEQAWRVRDKAEVKKLSPGWLVVFTQENAPESVLFKHREGMWPQAGLTMSWRFGLPGYGGDESMPWVTPEETAAPSWSGIEGLRVYAPGFTEADEWQMVGSTRRYPWICGTPYVAACATSVGSLTQTLAAKKMPAALPITTLLNRMFAWMKDAEFEEGVEWMMGKRAEGTEENGEAVLALVDRAEGRAMVRRESRAKELVSRVETLKASLHAVEMQIELAGKNRDLKAQLVKAKEMGLIKEAAVTRLATWFRLDQLVARVTKEVIREAIRREKVGPEGGPGLYLVRDAVVQVPHDAAGSGLFIYEAGTMLKHPHPHLAYGDARPCLGHGDSAQEMNVRLLDGLWDTDVVRYIQWVRIYLTETNLEAGYQPIWTVATKVGELEETAEPVEVSSAVRVTRVA